MDDTPGGYPPSQFNTFWNRKDVELVGRVIKLVMRFNTASISVFAVVKISNSNKKEARKPV